jgi:hypothetical protein
MENLGVRRPVVGCIARLGLVRCIASDLRRGLAECACRCRLLPSETVLASQGCLASGVLHALLGRLLAALRRSIAALTRFLISERTNRDVVFVRISQGELLGSRVRVHVWLFFEARSKSAFPPQCHLVVVDAEEQKEAVAGCPVVGTLQGRMVLDTPLVKAEQHSSIRVEKLTKVGMARGRRGWPNSDWYHLKLLGTRSPR